MVQVLLDPASLDREALFELRGKAYMLKLIQEMPRLVDDALKDFEAQRLGEEKEQDNV